METREKSSVNENVDRISSLPDEVLSHILSLMPTKMAVRTSILSERWTYKWTLINNLDFDDSHPFHHGLHCFSKFVNRVLGLCKTSQLHLFRLHCSGIWVPKSRVSKWISEAVRLNVVELDIQVVLLELPRSLFTCRSLTKLRIVWNDQDCVDWFIWSPVNLPCLKSIELVVFSKPSFMSAIMLIHGCPLLESLSIHVECTKSEEYNFNIPTLKRLILGPTRNLWDISKVVLNVPNLEYLCIDRFFFSVHDPVFQLSFDSFSAELPNWRDCNLHLPEFRNLKHLELTCWGSVWLIVSQFLERCSQLEHLCIAELVESFWIEPELVPICMQTNLKTMKVAKCRGWKCEIQFIEFMLRKAEVLKTVTVVCEGLGLEEEVRLYAKLLKLPRASRYCEIHVVGSWSDKSATS